MARSVSSDRIRTILPVKRETVDAVLKSLQKGENEVALQLFKLAGEPIPAITTSQANYKYFHTLSATKAIASGSVFSLKVSTWFNNAGTVPAAFITGQANESLCINGVLQQSGLYAVVSTAVRFTAPVGGVTLRNGYPFTLETYNANAILSTTRTFAVP